MESNEAEGHPTSRESTSPSRQQHMDVGDDNDDDDDNGGPPPGWEAVLPHSVRSPAAPSSAVSSDTEIGSRQLDTEDEDDGPPPGWESIYSSQPSTPTPPTPPALVLSDIEIESKQDNQEDEDDGPPPGWQPMPTLQLSCLPASSGPCDIEMQEKQEFEDEDDGPPPGWESIPLPQPLLPSVASPLLPPVEVMGSSQNENEDEDEGPPPGWQSIRPFQESLEPSPQLSPLSSKPSSTAPDMKMGLKQEVIKNEECPSTQQSMIPPKRKPPISTTPSTDKAQLVCGSCRKLLSYPRGAKFVQCTSCQTTNFVLEAHQVGRVKCGACATLLMYPFGAPSVRCASCRCVTEIGAHNTRPPLSEQQQQARRLIIPKPVH